MGTAIYIYTAQFLCRRLPIHQTERHEDTHGPSHATCGMQLSPIKKNEEQNSFPDPSLGPSLADFSAHRQLLMPIHVVQYRQVMCLSCCLHRSIGNFMVVVAAVACTTIGIIHCCTASRCSSSSAQSSILRSWLLFLIASA